MANEPHPGPGADRSLDRDLYCLTCGYNLRGLSGDPVRCPECGNLNPVADIEVPAEVIRQQLRRMETNPALCVGAVLFGAPLGGIVVAFLLGQIQTVAPVTAVCSCIGIPLVIALGTWFVCMIQFAVSCGRKLGWVGALVMYHVWGLGLIAVTIGAFAAYLVSMHTLTRRLSGPAGVSLSVVGAALLAPGLILWVRWAHRHATARLGPLQREVAVSIARVAIRKRLVRPHRGLFG